MDLANAENRRVYFSHVPDGVETYPNCKDYTVKRTSTVVTEATYSHSGELLIEKKCYSCDYYEQQTKTIARKTVSSSSSGGGSSGGGGAGGSW